MMTKNKRYRISQGYNDRFCHDWKKNKLLNFRQTVDLLNSQEEIITEQKEYLTRMGQGNHLKTIMEQKERIKELEQENKRLKQGKYIYGVHGGSNDRK